MQSRPRSAILSPMKTALLSALSLSGAIVAATLASEDKPFQPLFDGQSLQGWEGDPRFWRVEDGAIVGQTTEENKAERNTFLVYTPSEFSDFELRFSYQVDGQNSGVQYRSEMVGEHLMKGLQADFEARWHTDKSNPDRPPFDRFSGMFFEERGRMFLGQRGDMVIVRPAIEEGKRADVEKIASLGDPSNLEEAINRDGWNEYTIIANGNQYTHIINARVMSIGIDEDPQHFRASGLIGFQLHSGRPMKIQIKNVRIRQL